MHLLSVLPISSNLEDIFVEQYVFLTITYAKDSRHFLSSPPRVGHLIAPRSDKEDLNMGRI